jgi:hypothetical protein
MMGVLMVIGQPHPVVQALGDAVNTAITAHHPGHGLSALQRSWLACCLAASLGPNAVRWARCERASLGTYALAALSWLFRHANIPWALLLVASVRVLLRHAGSTPGSLVADDRDQPRATSAKKMASLHDLRDKASGGCMLGQRLVFLLLVTPKRTSPMGFAFDLPAPERTSWYQQERPLRHQGIPRKRRPPTPPPNPHYPTTQELALRLLEQGKPHHPALHVHGSIADALYGSAALRDGASPRFGGGQVISQLRRNQRVRVSTREPHVADDFATHPGTPQQLRSRGGDEMAALVGRARLSVCAQHTTRFVIALQDDGEDPYRGVRAADLSWRTLASVHARTLRWLVEVLVQDWQASDGGDTLATPPGEEGARRRVMLSLLVDHGLFVQPAHHAPRLHHLPA